MDSHGFDSMFKKPEQKANSSNEVPVIKQTLEPLIFTNLRRFTGLWVIDNMRSHSQIPLLVAKEVPNVLAIALDKSDSILLKIELIENMFISINICDDRYRIEANGPFVELPTFYGTIERYRIRWDPDAETLETETKLLDKKGIVYESYTILDNDNTLCQSLTFQMEGQAPSDDYPIKRFFNRQIEEEKWVKNIKEQLAKLNT